MLSLVFPLGLVFATTAVAHPPPIPEDTSSASDMIKKKKKTPYEAVEGNYAEDKQAYKREGYLDIASVRVHDEDPLRVEVGLYEALEPEPGGLVIFLLNEGDKVFRYAAYLPEPAEDGTPGEWGLFKVSKRNIFDDPIGGASYTRDDAVMTVTIPRADIPLDGFLVHAFVLSGPDNDNLWKDDAPNERKGIAVPPRAQ